MHRVSNAEGWIERSHWVQRSSASFLEDNFVFTTPDERDSRLGCFQSSSDHGSAKISNSASLKNPHKVGIGTWDFDANGTALADLDIFDFSWYTNWQSEPLWSPRGHGIGDARFVPMVFGKADVTSANIKALKGTESGYLLTFNEPDNKDQANMSVNEAIKLWPKLLKTGLEIGSPACTTSETLGEKSWLGKFMNLAEKKGYEVDFVAVHYYSENPSIAEFKEFLRDVYKEYGKPVWVTEWALVDWDNPDRFGSAEIAAFAEAATRMMDGLSFVKRQAWFGAYDGGDGWHINTELLDARGELTKVGDTFYDLLL